MNSKQVVLSFVLVFLMVTPCLATHSQGLEWKYGEGFQYDFRELFYRGENETTELVHEWTYYLIAPDYYDLADPLNSSLGVPSRGAFTYWPNGTEMQMGRLSFAVPVGNWPLLSSIIQGMSDNSTTFLAFETDITWGYVQDHTTDISSNMHRMEFAKSNGVLTKLTFETVTFDHYQLFRIERLDTSPVIIQLGVTIIAAICIVSVLFIYTRMKK